MTNKPNLHSWLKTYLCLMHFLNNRLRPSRPTWNQNPGFDRQLIMICFSINQIFLKIACTTALVAAIGHLSNSQTVLFDHLPQGDDLKQAVIRDIAQDRQGFIWLGTEYGLVKYDGYHYQFFANDPLDSNSLPDNYVIDILVDKDEPFLWVGSNGGVSKFNLETHNFKNYRHDPNDPNSLARNTVLKMAEAKDGTIWIGLFGGGLDRLDPKTGNIEHYKHDPMDSQTIGGNSVDYVMEDPNGAIWYMAGAEIERLDPGTSRIDRFTHELGQLMNGFGSIARGPDRIWFLTKKGIFQYNFKEKAFAKLPFDPADFSQ